MKTTLSYRHTIIACYIGYVTQAITGNFAPLLFLTFHNTYGIPLEKIGLLVLLNFGTQLMVDLASAKFADRIGYRILVVAAHIFAAAGLILLGILPEVLPDPFTGLCTAVILYAVGGGLIEVLISPVMEACPTTNKSAAMGLLHSFYCWGSVLVVAASTLLFPLLDSWKVTACLWAVIPACNAVYFLFVPIRTLTEDGTGMSIRELIGSRLFWCLALLMVCAGASELAMSQWASAFAESALGVSKAVGDLAGPCLFAILMGTARVVHAKSANDRTIPRNIAICAALCVLGYLLSIFSPLPLLSLLGCGICGFSVGIFWPGVFSLSALKCPRGGTAMFALLALAGDCGCSAGPALVGWISGMSGDDLRAGLLCAVGFPAVLLIALFLLRRAEQSEMNAA